LLRAGVSIQTHHVTLGGRYVHGVRIHGQAPKTRKVARPDDLPILTRQARNAPLVGYRKQIIAIGYDRGVDIDQTLQLGTAVRLPHGRLPGGTAVAEAHGHHAAIVETAHRQIPNQKWSARAAQRQAWHLLIDHPVLAAIFRRQTMQLAVDAAHHDYPVADGRGRENLRIDAHAPARHAVL